MHFIDHKRVLLASCFIAGIAQLAAVDVPLPPFPAIPPKQPVNSVPMDNVRTAPEVKIGIPIAPGPYQPTWESIEKNYPGTPDWLREAKFGIWVHFGPQAAGESGDWYARRLYRQGSPAYNNHVKRYGHPSEVGYKDVLRTWNPVKFDPAALAKLYKEAGARYLLIQAVHHDNYDLWDSKYQPWNSNSPKLGAHRDFIGEWAKALKKEGMRYGIAFHHEYNWWWNQTAFGSDTTGPKAGVPYDGNLTLADGKGKWWEGMDPRMLYGIDLTEYQSVKGAAESAWNPPRPGVFGKHLAYAQWYATWWALRMMDVVDKYDPDFIYTDGTDQQPFSGSGTGTGIKADAMQTVIAHFYNRMLQVRKKVDGFSIVKFRNKTNGTVNTTESRMPGDIKTDQPWIAEAQVGDWFYKPNIPWRSKSMIRTIVEAASRDGAVALCIPPRPDGSLEDECVTMLKEVGVWMRMNGEAIYGSKAWTVLGEGDSPDGKPRLLPGGAVTNSQADFKYTTKDFRFTVGKNGSLYVICMADAPKQETELVVKSLGTAANRLGKPVTSVRLVGSKQPIAWKQTDESLLITCPANAPSGTAVTFEIR
jgi:alpha-L-fucosidase